MFPGGPWVRSWMNGPRGSESSKRFANQLTDKTPRLPMLHSAEVVCHPCRRIEVAIAIDVVLEAVAELIVETAAELIAPSSPANN